MALRKVMTLEEIRKHSKNIMRGLSALSRELESLALEANSDGEGNFDFSSSQTDEAEFVEDKVYGYAGADDIVSELITLLLSNRKEVKEMRRV